MAETPVSEPEAVAAHAAYDAIRPLEYSYVPFGPCAFNVNEDYGGCRKVEITHHFAIGQAPVTQGQYRRVMGHNHSTFNEDSHGERASERPMVDVSWFDALAFCNKLSDAAGLPRFYRLRNRAEAPTAGEFANHPSEIEFDDGGLGFRLPTDDEFLCALQGGTSAAYPEADAELDDIGWSESNAADGDTSSPGKKPEGRTHPIGQKAPNPQGIHDLFHVWNWTQNLFAPDILDRVLRGASWGASKSYMWLLFRNQRLPWVRLPTNGIRVTRTLPTPS